LPPRLWQQSDNVPFGQSSWTPACGRQRKMKIDTKAGRR
jgi:hypothetical protein